MRELALHILDSKRGEFAPKAFEDLLRRCTQRIPGERSRKAGRSSVQRGRKHAEIRRHEWRML